MGFDNNIILKNLKEFNLIVASKSSKAKLEEINILKLEANEEEIKKGEEKEKEKEKEIKKGEEKEKEKKSRFCHMVLKWFAKMKLS